MSSFPSSSSCIHLGKFTFRCYKILTMSYHSHLSCNDYTSFHMLSFLWLNFLMHLASFFFTATKECEKISTLFSPLPKTSYKLLFFFLSLFFFCREPASSHLPCFPLNRLLSELAGQLSLASAWCRAP